MTAKTEIVDFLGERALVLPALLSAALAANERAKYILTLLQMAASQAENPQASPPSLRRSLRHRRRRFRPLGGASRA